MIDTAREAESRQFFAGAASRAVRIGGVLTLVALALAAIFFGKRVMVPLALGALVGALNTWWLARSTASFARRAVASADPGREGERPGSAGILFQYALRYLLVAIAAYAIFKSTLFSILGFFAGLFLPVVSLMSEALYEAWVSNRRGL